jgi:hypothetical protein
MFMNLRSVSLPLFPTSARLFAVLVFAMTLGIFQLHAQGSGDLQAKVSDLKENSAKNKAALAQYTWEETVRIILKGEEKKTEHFQVRQGPDGKPVKTPIDPQQQAAQQKPGGRGGRLKERVVEKKKEEFKDYADQMQELAQHYVPPDKDGIQAAYAKGNISITPDPSGDVKLVIRDYYKPGDTVTLRIDKAQKQLQAISIATYMDDPKDAMNLTVSFGRLPDGTNHVSNVTIEGVSKQLTVNTTNSNYQKL